MQTDIGSPELRHDDQNIEGVLSPLKHNLTKYKWICRDKQRRAGSDSIYPDYKTKPEVKDIWWNLSFTINPADVSTWEEETTILQNFIHFHSYSFFLF